MRSTLAIIGRQLGLALIGPLPVEVRRNVRIETIAAIAYGVFYAAVISFMPVVLRRLAASSSLLALYTAHTYLGSILSTLGVLIMRRRRPLAFALICWLGSRGLLLWTFLIVNAGWLLALTAVFWLLESMPAPAYARIVQAIYPVAYRGRALAVVRVGMVLAILIATPLAGNMYWGRLVDRHGGLWVVRANVAIAVLVPLTYIWAFDAWTLLPAFIAHGIISAGVDLGIISAGMELAHPESVVEYSALQATIIGLRGLLAPFFGIALLSLGLPARLIFAIGCGFIVLGWLFLGLVTMSRRRPVAEQWEQTMDARNERI